MGGFGNFVSKAASKAGGLIARNAPKAAGKILGKVAAPVGIVYDLFGNPVAAGGQGADSDQARLAAAGYNKAGVRTTPSGGAQSAPAGAAVPTGGLYAGGGGGGAGSYDPNVDPAAIARNKGDVAGLMGAFERAYTDVFGKVDTLAAEKKAAFIEKYEGEKGKLKTNYANTSRQIDDVFSARNAYHSNYRTIEQDTAKGAFEDAYKGVENAEQEDLAGVGRFAEEQKAALATSRPNYNLDDYNEVDDLLSLKADVDAALRKLTETGASLGTNSDYVNKLNSITPRSETGSAQLKAQLDRLANTNAPPEAKKIIAAQTINDAGEDPEEWMDYFDRVQASTGSAATAQPALAGI
jgi:hypothetical protein